MAWSSSWVNLVQLIHLIVNVTVSGSLKYLMPLFSFWVKLIHIISSTVWISSSKQIEKATVLNNSMPSSRGINNFVVHHLFHLVTISLNNTIHIGSNIFLALFVIHIFFWNDTFPFSKRKIFIKLWIVYIDLVVWILNIVIVWVQIIIQIFKLTILLYQIRSCSMLPGIASWFVIEHSFENV